MCVAEVDKVYKHRDELKKLGVGMAAVLRENIPDEVERFKKNVWHEEPIYLDSSFALFGSIAGGTPNEINAEYFMEQFGKFPEGKADEKFTANMGKAMKLADGYMGDDKHNMVGAGFMTGGIYVLKQGGAVQWAHHEPDIGLTADAADVVSAAKLAAASGDAEPCCTGCTIS